jgi:hypothetical protein
MLCQQVPVGKDILVFRLDALRDQQEKHAQLQRWWYEWKL